MFICDPRMSNSQTGPAQTRQKCPVIASCDHRVNLKLDIMLYERNIFWITFYKLNESYKTLLTNLLIVLDIRIIIKFNVIHNLEDWIFELYEIIFYKKTINHTKMFKNFCSVTTT